MVCTRCLVLLFLAILLPSTLHAETISYPDLISFGAGEANFDRPKLVHRTFNWHFINIRSADLRFEYRWGTSLLPMLSKGLSYTERYFTIHPYVGAEMTSLGVAYGLGGIATDIYMGPHAILTWSEGVGLYAPGAAVRLGSVVEIRSMGEIGWRFENNLRLSAFLSHTSNANITKLNPGSETFGGYIHVPVNFLSGQ